MPSADEPSSTHTNGTSSRSDQLAHYKKQYEQLESELADFQASSRELEVELEKEIEASEKRERQLKEKVDNLRYEVDEWKVRSNLFIPVFGLPTHRFVCLFLVQIQAIQVRSQYRPEYTPERNYLAAGHEFDATVETAGHRSCK